MLNHDTGGRNSSEQSSRCTTHGKTFPFRDKNFSERLGYRECNADIAFWGSNSLARILEYAQSFIPRTFASCYWPTIARNTANAPFHDYLQKLSRVIQGTKKTAGWAGHIYSHGEIAQKRRHVSRCGLRTEKPAEAHSISRSGLQLLCLAFAVHQSSQFTCYQI